MVKNIKEKISVKVKNRKKQKEDKNIKKAKLNKKDVYLTRKAIKKKI